MDIGEWGSIIREVDSRSALSGLALIVLGVLLWPVSKLVLKWKNDTKAALSFAVLVVVAVLMLVMLGQSPWLVDELQQPTVEPVAPKPLPDSVDAPQTAVVQVDVTELRLMAEQGDVRAQRSLGIMYEIGRGVARDHETALRWYRQAAVQGDAQAQTNLGAMYANGRGVTQNDADAVRWFRRAAEQRYAHAQKNLGVMSAFLGKRRPHFTGR